MTQNMPYSGGAFKNSKATECAFLAKYNIYV